MVQARESLQNAGLEYESADVEFISTIKIESDADTAEKVIRLIDALEELDDVQNVYTNMDVSQAVMAELEAGG
jgi:transcriptional/translational regulatory protein YebC/TACO1